MFNTIKLNIIQEREKNRRHAVKGKNSVEYVCYHQDIKAVQLSAVIFISISVQPLNSGITISSLGKNL